MEKSPEKRSKMKQPPKDSRTESQQKENIITVNNSEKKSANVVERYEGIKERFDSLAKRFEKYIEHKGEEEPPIKRGENFLENIEEEKDHLKSSDHLDSNKQESLIPLTRNKSLRNKMRIPYLIRMRKQWSKARRS